MTRYAHLVKRYSIEYDDTSFPAAVVDEVYAMLIGIKGVKVGLADYAQLDCDWEIFGLKKLKKYIKQLMLLPPDEVHEKFKSKSCKCNHSNREVICILKRWYKHRDLIDGCIRVHWF